MCSIELHLTALPQFNRLYADNSGNFFILFILFFLMLYNSATTESCKFHHCYTVMDHEREVLTYISLKLTASQFN